MSTEVFPNSPLVEVVFEIRFPGDPSFECKRDVVFRKFKDQFPVVQVPSVFPNDRPLAFVPYKFVSADGTKSMAVAINSIFFSTTQYAGYDAFSKEAIGALNAIAAEIPLDKINRTGLRYVNMIPFSREAGAVPLGRFLNVGLKTPASIPKEFEDINIAFISRFDGGLLTTRVGRSDGKEGGTGEAIVLDFDYAKTEGLRFRQIKEYLKESHDHTKSLFTDMVTNQYLKVMRGEVLK